MATSGVQTHRSPIISTAWPSGSGSTAVPHDRTISGVSAFSRYPPARPQVTSGEPEHRAVPLGVAVAPARLVCSGAAGGTSARGRSMGVRFPGEYEEYRAARDRLLQQEIDLRRAMEAVAAVRRRLPPGGPVPQDYLFRGRDAEGAPADVRLSELFAPGKDSLLIYSMMFPRDPEDDRPGPASGRTALLPLLEGPCPSCTAPLDQLDGAAEHVAQRMNFVAVGKAPLGHILGFAADRGWRLRITVSRRGRCRSATAAWWWRSKPRTQEDRRTIRRRLLASTLATLGRCLGPSSTSYVER